MPILSLLLIVVLSILITRIATIALIHTGLSRESARFQARSAFTGAGFTTTESENVVRHLVRRRIVMLPMLLGNAGIVTAVASLILTFVGPEQQFGAPANVGALAAGVTLLWALSMIQWVEQRLSRLIAGALARYTILDGRDYTSLMHLAGEYQIGELQVDARDWLASRALREARLREEGVLVLGIKRPAGRPLRRRRYRIHASTPATCSSSKAARRRWPSLIRAAAACAASARMRRQSPSSRTWRRVTTTGGTEREATTTMAERHSSQGRTPPPRRLARVAVMSPRVAGGVTGGHVACLPDRPARRDCDC